MRKRVVVNVHLKCSAPASPQKNMEKGQSNIILEVIKVHCTLTAIMVMSSWMLVFIAFAIFEPFSWFYMFSFPLPPHIDTY